MSHVLHLSPEALQASFQRDLRWHDSPADRGIWSLWHFPSVLFFTLHWHPSDWCRTDQVQPSSRRPLWQDSPGIIKLLLLSPILRSIVHPPSTAPAAPATSSSSPEHRGADGAARRQREPGSLAQLHSKLSERNSEENTDVRLQRSQDQLRPLVTPGFNSLSPSCADRPDQQQLTHRHGAAAAPWSPVSAFLSSSAALPELLCRAGISTLVLTWLQELCSL